MRKKGEETINFCRGRLLISLAEGDEAFQLLAACLPVEKGKLVVVAEGASSLLLGWGGGKKGAHQKKKSVRIK